MAKLMPSYSLADFIASIDQLTQYISANISALSALSGCIVGWAHGYPILQWFKLKNKLDWPQLALSVN
jgi:hypothetical protein